MTPPPLSLYSTRGKRELAHRGLVNIERENIMAKKTQARCINCGTHDGLFIILKNGERLPSYTIKIGEGIICNECKEKAAA